MVTIMHGCKYLKSSVSCFLSFKLKMLNMFLKCNVSPIVFLPEITANSNTRLLTELLMEVKEMSRDIQFIKAEISKSSLNPAGPEAPGDTFPFTLPLTDMQHFNDAERALQEETVRRKMVINRFFVIEILFV